jgi:hypothetical protein
MDNNKDKKSEQKITDEEIERIKQNALFNLNFEKYKTEVKKQTEKNPEKYLEKIKQLRYDEDEKMCNRYDNKYLYFGIIFIVIAFFMMIFYSSPKSENNKLEISFKK